MGKKWICPSTSCGVINTSTRKKCRVCDEPNPDASSTLSHGDSLQDLIARSSNSIVVDSPRMAKDELFSRKADEKKPRSPSAELKMSPSPVRRQRSSLSAPSPPVMGRLLSHGRTKSNSSIAESVVASSNLSSARSSRSNLVAEIGMTRSPSERSASGTEDLCARASRLSIRVRDTLALVQGLTNRTAALSFADDAPGAAVVAADVIAPPATGGEGEREGGATAAAATGGERDHEQRIADLEGQVAELEQALEGRDAVLEALEKERESIRAARTRAFSNSDWVLRLAKALPMEKKDELLSLLVAAYPYDNAAIVDSFVRRARSTSGEATPSPLSTSDPSTSMRARFQRMVSLPTMDLSASDKSGSKSASKEGLATIKDASEAEAEAFQKKRLRVGALGLAALATVRISDPEGSKRAAVRRIDKIDEKLWLSSREGVSSKEEMRERGITHVLTIGAYMNPHFPDDFEYMVHDHIKDASDQNLLAVLPECFAFIDRARTTGGGVVVHCQGGVSRSPTVVSAYLMKTQGLSLEEAMEKITSARSVVKPNDGFTAQLKLFHEMGCKLDTESPLYQEYLQGKGPYFVENSFW